MVKRGSIVLIRYPFTDLSSSKVRPAVVLTPDNLTNEFNDILCLFISSVIPLDLLSTDFVLELNHPSFLKTGLKKRSVFRTHKLALLNKSLISRKLGELDREIMEEINKRLKITLGL